MDIEKERAKAVELALQWNKEHPDGDQITHVCRNHEGDWLGYAEAPRYDTYGGIFVSDGYLTRLISGYTDPWDTVTEVPQLTFMDKVMDGTIKPEDHSQCVDDCIDKWHQGKGHKSLSEYLGMTTEEYVFFMKNPDVKAIYNLRCS